MATPVSDSYAVASGASIYAGRTAANNLVALMGDSLTDDSYGLSSFYPLNANTGGKLVLTANAGISGNTVQNMLSRVNNSYTNASPGLAGLPPLGRVFIRAGTNNARGNEAISGLASAYTSLLQACATYAAKVIILAVPPLANAGNNATAASYNAWLADYASKNPTKFKFVDDCVNLRAGDGSQIASFFNADGVHFAGPGVAQCGIDGAIALAADLASYASPLITDPADVYPATNQWFPNPTILGTGGTKDGSFTGTVANNLGISAYGAGVNGACSIVTADAGDAISVPWQRMTITAGNSGSKAQLTAGPVGRTITSTDPSMLDTVMQIRFVGVDRSKISGVTVMAQAWDGEYLVPATNYWLVDTGTEDRTIVLRATHKRSGASTPAGITFYFSTSFRSTFTGNAGSIDVRCISMRG